MTAIKVQAQRKACLKPIAADGVWKSLPAPEFDHLGQGYGALDLWSDNALPVSHGGQKTFFFLSLV